MQLQKTPSEVKKPTSSVERILESYGAQVVNEASIIKFPPRGDMESTKIKSALVSGVPAMDIFKSLLQQ